MHDPFCMNVHARMNGKGCKFLRPVTCVPQKQCRERRRRGLVVRSSSTMMRKSSSRRKSRDFSRTTTTNTRKTKGSLSPRASNRSQSRGHGQPGGASCEDEVGKLQDQLLVEMRK